MAMPSRRRKLSVATLARWDTPHHTLMPFLSLPQLSWISQGFRNDGYKILSTKPTLRRYSRLITLRRLVHFLASISALLVVTISLSGIPPNFNDVRSAERSLPQHNLSLARNDHRRYLRFASTVTGRGLNNVMQQSLLMSHVAYSSNRSYVFHDYVWSELPLPYTIYDFALRPTRMPFTAFISGASAGGAINGASTSLRGVSEEFWNEICPPERVRVFSSMEAPTGGEGIDIMKWWKDALDNVQDECVEVSPDKNVFDDFLFGEKRILSLWPELSVSPALRQFAWSPLVFSAVLRNYALLFQSSSTATAINRNTVLEGLVAVHLRRGDYSRHCVNLEKWNANWMGFNSFPELTDKFIPPPEGPERLQYYLKHCYPTQDEIVQRLREIREKNPSLRTVYLLSNGWEWWLRGLAKDLNRDGWENVAHTNQLFLDSEQYWVSGAVDMAIAEMAEVFVGNGFSSLSSNVVMLRMANGRSQSSNRFL